MPCNYGGRDWSDEDENQGALGIACNHWTLGEKHGADSPSGPQKRACLWTHLLWASGHLNCERIDFCWLK